MESRRHGRPPTATSDILDFYFQSVTGDLGPGLIAGDRPRQEKTSEDGRSSRLQRRASECSRSSSVYSTDTLKDTPTPCLDSLPKAGHSSNMPTPIREVFRNLCQVGLHIANLRHARNEAHKQLEVADSRVDSLAHELVLARLGRTDQIDSSSQAIDQITVILERDEKGDQNEHSIDNDTDSNRLREAVRNAKQLKTAFYTCRRQLETGQRVLLWPTLEQWRLAVDEFRRQGSTHTAGVSTQPSILTVSSLDGLDRVTREIEILLPQLGRHRLEHLLGYITAALQQEGEEDISNYVPNFI